MWGNRTTETSRLINQSWDLCTSFSSFADDSVFKCQTVVFPNFYLSNKADVAAPVNFDVVCTCGRQLLSVSKGQFGSRLLLGELTFACTEDRNPH